MQDKMVLVKFQNALLLHPAQLLGQCAAVQIEIVCQSLAVKGDMKGGASCLCGLFR